MKPTYTPSFVNKTELIKVMPNISDEQAEYIVQVILYYKKNLVEHSKRILEKDQEIHELKVKLGIIKEEPKEDAI